MTVDVEETSQSFGQLIGSIPDLSNKFSLNKILDDSCIDEAKLTTWYDNTLEKYGGSNPSQVFELAAKNLMYRYVHESNENVLEGSSTSVFLFGTLLDLTIILVRLGRVDHSLPLILIEELFEIQTIGWCQVFWPYMISREKTLTVNLTGTRAPGTTLIRFCNSLLRRLSKNQNAQFSGEIAIFLARAFPLTEKSGLNIRGSFNTDNVTFYEGGETSAQEKEQDVLMEDKNSPSNTSKGLTEEQTLYRQFWSLQSVFSNPTQLTTSSEALAEFKTTLSEILAELKRRESAHNAKRNREDEQRKLEIELEEDDGDEGVFVPKWLTRPDLFELQLKDVPFRRSILTQASIIVDFLLGLSEKSKAKWGPDQLGATNKSVMFPFTLIPEDVSFFQNMQKSFQRTSFTSVDFDPAYLRTINTIMQRDKYWQDWKLQNCPSFELAPLDDKVAEQAKANLENVLTKPRKKFWHAMGTAPLTKIWKIQTGIESLKNPKRFTIPDAKTYYDAIKEETAKFTDEHTIEVPEDPPKDTKAPEAKVSKEEQESNLGKEDTDDDIQMIDTPKEKEPTPPPVMIKKFVVEKEEKRKFDEEIGSKTWRGLRAARSQGYWAKFGLVTKEMGFSGLYEKPPVNETQPPAASSQTPMDIGASSPMPHLDRPASGSSTPSQENKVQIPQKRPSPDSAKPLFPKIEDGIISTPTLADESDGNLNKRKRID